MITRVAIKRGDRLWIGVTRERHGDVMQRMIDQGIPIDDIADATSGFIDDAGNFLTRREAVDHVRACGQATMYPIRADRKGLQSEDVW